MYDNQYFVIFRFHYYVVYTDELYILYKYIIEHCFSPFKSSFVCHLNRPCCHSICMHSLVKLVTWKWTAIQNHRIKLQVYSNYRFSREYDKRVALNLTLSFLLLLFFLKMKCWSHIACYCHIFPACIT